MGWTKLIPKGLPVGRESKLDVGLNGIPTSLKYNEPKDAYIKELKRGRDLTISDDPKRGACGRSNESCRNSIIKVSELKHDVKSNINLPQAEDEYTKWKTGHASACATILRLCALLYLGCVRHISACATIL